MNLTSPNTRMMWLSVGEDRVILARFV